MFDRLPVTAIRTVMGAGMVAVAPTVPLAQAALRTRVRSWIDSNQTAVVRELLELLAIPNVAADRANIRRNADHLRQMLGRRGFAAEVLETAGNPLVYGELR